MEVKDLKGMTVKELREVAKCLGIVGRWEMSKEQLVEVLAVADRIALVAPLERCNEQLSGCLCDNGLSDDMITFESDCIIRSKDSNESEGLQKVSKTTDEYLKGIAVGTLVAFKRSKNKEVAMSGKFVSFNEAEDKVLIESKKGTCFKVARENIVWVKTGARWPKWVFSLFNKEKEEVDENALS